MEKEIRILPTVVDHIRQIVPILREDDLREIEKYGVSPFKGIWRTYRSSKVCRSGFIGDKIVAIWGLNGSVLGFCANPWVVTSTLVDEYPLVFATIYRRELREMLKSYRLLESFVDASYTKSLRMMRIVGFKERELVPSRIGGALFVRLEMEGA